MTIDEAMRLTTVNEEYLQKLYEEQGYLRSCLKKVNDEIERVKEVMGDKS